MITYNYSENLQDSNLPEIVISYKNPIPIENRKSIVSSSQMDNIFRKIWDDGTIDVSEQVKVIYFNKALHVLGFVNLTMGSIDGCIIDVRRLFAIALKINASALAVAHNHPSGNTSPSRSDMEITEKLKSCSKFHDLLFIDHLIITSDSYYSFADNGNI